MLNPTHTEIRILGLTDVAIGYGSPQVQYLLRSLAEEFAPATCLIIEPDQKGRPSRPPLFPELNVERIVTMMPPYDLSFQIEFNRAALKIMREFRPDIIVASHGWVLPAALQMKPRPKCFIYYMLESLDHQVQGGSSDWAIELNRLAFAMADLVVIPERQRAAADLRSYGWSLPSLIEAYNVTPWQRVPLTATRKPRILYAGTLGPQTLCEFFLDESVSDVEFVIAGAAETEPARRFLEQASERDNIRYLGFLSSHKLATVRQENAYSITMWRPDSINQLFACPNKFYESIAVGVPPIAAPHPQCADIIARHNCGLVMMDWTVNCFAWTVHHALDLFNAEDGRYQTMVENCLLATQGELNWEAQFAKIRSRLPSRIALVSG